MEGFSGEMDEKYYWIALNLVPGIGKVIYHRLVGYFGDPENVFNAPEKELMRIDKIGEGIAKNILSFRFEEELKREIDLVEQEGVSVLTLNDSSYPDNLRSIFAPPPILYVKGELRESDTISIAVVGSRTPTNYGKLITDKLSKELAKREITIISGMARGIDSCAHRGAIYVGGRTIAVFGCGLNIVYPPENRRLRDEIAENGAIISEFPMSMRPEKMNFPMRNQIISGLSLGTVVVEAAEKSGSLITARYALDQNREVFAVPGNINSLRSRGTNRLIKMGAKLVEDVDDIINELPPYIRMEVLATPSQEEPARINLSEEEEHVFSLITSEKQYIDFITEKSVFPSNQVAGILVRLELNGLIKQLSGKMFVRS